MSGGHLRRPMYYLTGGDETLGELARYALLTDQTIIKCEGFNAFPFPNRRWLTLCQSLPQGSRSVTFSPSRRRRRACASDQTGECLDLLTLAV